jgi:hypothetical protein
LEDRILLSLISAPRFYAGYQPRDAIVSDFNGDGKPDAVIASYGGWGVNIVLGNGDGTFQSPIGAHTSNDVRGIAVGDFNGDGKIDVAATADDDLLNVMLGNGDGTLQPATTYAGAGRGQLVVGDFNGDGYPDVVTTNWGSNFLSFFQGRGDGTLAPAVDLPTQVEQGLVIAGDYNGDGKLDLVVTAGPLGNIVVLLGNGDGTFHAGASYSLNGSPSSLASSDLNSDGRPDLIVTNGRPGGVWVLMGRGDGTFEPAVGYTAGTTSGSVAVADLDGDGHVDLAVANQSSDDVSVLPGRGDGTFGPAVNYVVGVGAASVVTADFNQDGRSDLVATDPFGYGGSVLLGSDGGKLYDATDVPAGVPSPWAIAAQDLNGDGKPDFVTVSRSGAALAVAWGNGDGTFQPPHSYSVGQGAQAIAIGDLNGDGRPDLVTANDTAGTISVLLANPDGTYQAARDWAVGQRPQDVILGDFNGDGKLDAAVVTYKDNRLTILLGQGDGTFGTPLSVSTGSGPVSLVAGDFNGDGKLDLATADYGSGDVGIWLGNGDGTFVLAHTYYSYGASSLAVADMNGDGKLDLVAGAGGVVIFQGNGDGSFHYPAKYGDASSVGVGVADFNHDGRLDVVVLSSTPSAYSDEVSLFLRNSDGTFQAPIGYWGGQAPQGVAVADWNGDGLADIATADAGTGISTVTILLQAPSPAVRFREQIVGQAAAGTPLTLSVTALDAQGHTATSYLGTVHFTSSDARAVLPADYTFTPADHGVHTFTVTLRTAGSRTLTATDRYRPTLVGTATINIQPAAVQVLVVAGFPSPGLVGDPGTFTVTAQDPYGNTVGGYRGTVTFHSTDPHATLPSSYTFTSTDLGQHSFTATFMNTGLQSLAATDAAGRAGSQTDIAVNSQNFTVAEVALFTVEGAAFAGTVGGFRDTQPQPASAYTASVDWGDGSTSSGSVTDDGSGGFLVAGGHTYAEEGPYTIIVRIKDPATNQAFLFSSADVADAPLFAQAVDVSASEGVSTGPVTLATFTDQGGAELTAGYTAAIAWGDGTTDSGTIVANADGSFAVQGSHVYSDNGSYTIRVTIGHESAPPAVVTGTALIASVGPSAAVSGLSAVLPYETALFTFSASDPSSWDQAAPFSFAIDWGDGSQQSLTTLSPTALAHSYGADGTYLISVTATDKDGTSGPTSTFSVIVTNALMRVNDLLVGGTTGDDAIVFVPGTGVGDLQVSLNGQSLGTFHPTGSVRVYGWAGTDTVTVNGRAVADRFVLNPNAVVFNGRSFRGDAIESLVADGQAGDDTFTYHGGNWSIDGGTGTDTLVGPNAVSQWVLTGVGSGTIKGKTFTEIENLTGGSLADTFALRPGGSLAGTIDGGGGVNTLSYAGATTAVAVDLSAGTATDIAGGIANIQNVTGGAGNDTLTGDAGDNLLVGGAGNDVLNGGAGGNDILVGGAGNDVLTGGPGRSLLLGGGGADTLNGGGDDDLLIAGPTSYDSNTTALLDLLSEWKRSDADYATRIAHLRGTQAGGRNGSFFLGSTTVKNDTSADLLTGGPGQDWFWASLPQDTLTDRAADEVVN